MRGLHVLLLIGLVSGAPQAEEEPEQPTDAELADIFGSPEDAQGKIENPEEPPPPPPVPPVNGCVCVPFYQCNNGTVNMDGTGLIDIRFDGRTCNNLVDVCCNTDEVDRTAVLPKPPISQGCGFRNVDGVGFRIIGDKDNEAQFGEFPWTGIVLRRETINDNTVVNVFQCGCSLIHPMAAVTAAHCVAGKSPDTLRLRFGEWDTKTSDELYPHQDRVAAKVIIHDKFYAGALFNDIAVIIFDRPIEIAPNVNILCLPPPGSVFDSATCVASGWGKDNFSKRGNYQLIMKKVALRMVPFDACQTALRSTRLGHYFKLHESFVCAGGEEGKDTCTGDGGSPLVCPIEGKPNRYYQVGIVAWGIGCGTKGVPGVYVNVPLFTNWIQKAMSSSGINEFYHKP